ncbi:Cysteine-rich secretory protein family [Clostridium perfringens]|uniref:Cysteine-rich secretory protein family n=2 Tax=Clostridium perfringens TaxID=1502 RepID=A0A2X3C314_CLOPF|nr:CAP domain-containing protein [Clostridium perfringens]SQC06304.1 Cysteine-rich secretory protein family [Clostridium perfringens]
MNKKIKAIIEFVKVHRKESIGVAVALGIAIIGVGGYAISSHYSKNNIEKSNIALAEKKEDINKENENKELDEENQEETTTESDVVVEEKEDGTLVVKDKEGNTIADSSKGDDVTKIVAEKKEAGSNVAIKDKDGKVEKVDKVENGSITITGGGTVTVKPPVIAENTKPSEPSKPNENKPNNSTGGNTESNQTPPTNNESSNNNPAPPVENKPADKPNNDSSNNNKPQDKPQEQVPAPKPPTENKPVEKPQEPVKPVRTWEYQSAMSNELWSLFNQYRQENGLNALTWSNKYNGWVKQHTEEMAQKESAFHKLYPEGGQVTGLNGASMTASKILQQFKNSPAHDANLLDDELTEGACAVYKDSNGVYYFVIGFDY